MSTPTPNEGDLSVWHVPQIPCPAFRVPVATIAEGIKLCDVLADYDLFQYDNRIKPDYANMSGIERWEDGEWVSVDDEELDPCEHGMIPAPAGSGCLRCDEEDAGEQPPVHATPGNRDMGGRHQDEGGAG